MDIICIEMMPFVETGNEISQRKRRNKKKEMKKYLRNTHSHSILPCMLVYIQSNLILTLLEFVMINIGMREESIPHVFC